MTSAYFSSIFGKSPVAPLQAHMEQVIACVRPLSSYFRAVFAGDWPQAGRLHGEIEQAEHAADELKNELRLHLPTSLLMPVDRRDVLEVLDLQDAIANKSRDIAGLVLGRRMPVPESLHSDYQRFLARCLDACVTAQNTINELDELVETGFRGDEAVRVQTIINELHSIESETDTIQVGLRAALYQEEGNLPPVDVMFLYQILTWTGDLADLAQSVGNRIQLMLAK